MIFQIWSCIKWAGWNIICSSSGSYMFLTEVQTTLIWSSEFLLINCFIAVGHAYDDGCTETIDPFLSIRFPWHYWRSSAEAWKSVSVVAWTHILQQFLELLYNAFISLSWRYSSMTIPWKPDTQNGVYTGGYTYYYTLLYNITVWPQVQEVQSHGPVITLNSTLG